MSKTYKIKVNSGQGEAKFVDIPQVGTTGKPLTVKAVAGGKYQLVDASTGFAPENIRANRVGKNLQVFFEGRATADLVVEDYYDVTAEGFNALIGEAESGRFYEYIPESAAGNTAVPALTDGSKQIGMALGGAEINPAGAAVGALVAAGLFNPLWLGAGALGAAAAAAGGGNDNGAGTGTGGTGTGGTDTTPPTVKSGKLHVDDDTGPKDNVTNDKTPRIVVETEPNANVEVLVNGKTYTGKANANGQAVIQIPDVDALNDGPYTPKITATDADKNKSAVFDGTPFTVDTNGPVDKGVKIVSMTVDSGVGSSLDESREDFITNDTTPIFTGTLDKELDEGERIEVSLLKGTEVIQTAFIATSDLNWSWGPLTSLPDAAYTLSARVIDAAGNPAVKAGTTEIINPTTQVVVIDTKGSKEESDGNRDVKTTSIHLSSDTAANGTVNQDFVTSDGGNKDGKSDTEISKEDDNITFTGTFNNTFIDNGAQVFIQVIGSDGIAVSKAFINPTGKNWTYKHLGPLAEGQYVAKAILMDVAGNIINSKDQSFLIDKTNSKWSHVGHTNTADGTSVTLVTFENYAFNLTEYGKYKFNNDDLLTYNGGNLILKDIKQEYQINEFKIEFWDQAGNLTLITNPQTWKFSNPLNPTNLVAGQTGYLEAKDFTGLKIIGSVGKITIDDNFDMAVFYDGIQNIENIEQAAVSHVALSTTKNIELNLSMGDVLALGVTNSFSVSDTHKGLTQMRIDGQSGDIVNLDGLVNGEIFKWEGGKGSTQIPFGDDRHDVYLNADMAVVLFIDSDITVKIF